ncbi:hypothetical protein M0R45_020998 [Rubus argutus]|uniref:Uncharacterized protein n=1 Tax=Rubus argutus TaxID=59490 RepID=A0AAW1XD46_RUBAR
MGKVIAARVFYGAAVLLTLGEAGLSAALSEFLDEQYLSEQDQKERIDDEKLQDRQKALWKLPRFLGAFVLFLFHATRERAFQISTIVMGVFYLFFWVGYPYYFIYSKSPRATEAETMYPIQDAERDETSIDTEELAEPAGRENFWGVMTKKMKDRKHLRYEILATWLTFLVYSAVLAAGDTFFYEQMSNLNDPIQNPGIILNLLRSSSKYISSFLWELLIPKKWKSNSRVRIGCGMVCTVLCCVAAWQVEIRRLKEVRKQGVGDDTSKAISISIFWLLPQFSLLGIMEGLAIDGLINFFVDRVAGDDDKAMVEYYGSHTTDFVIGVGKLLTAFSILAFRRRWFDDNVNRSRLDKYYRALTFMSVISFFFYVCVSTYYCTKDVSQDHAREENETNSHRIEQQESPPSQQNLSTSRQETSPPSQQEQPLH